jgi:hypothetical protein
MAKRAKTIDLLRVVDLLQEHITPALCRTVFGAVRRTERQRVWTLEALIRFWTAVVLRAPKALSQALVDSLEGRDPTFPRIEATPEAFCQRGRDLRPAFFAEVFLRFTARLVTAVPPRYAAEIAPGRERFAARVILDGSRLAALAHRLKLLWAHAERDTLAIRPLPATIEEEASGIRADAVRRYQSVGIECQQREDAIAELERLLPSPEQALNELTEATVRLLEAVVTVAREAFVRRVRESGELEHLRSRFERLTAASTTHAAEIEQWSQQVGRPLRIPRVAFLWPPARVWQALLDAPMDAPELLWDDDPRASSA